MDNKVSKPISLEPIGSDGDEVPTRPMSPLEAASFIEGMAAELGVMARKTRLSTLCYFLEMARIEASAEIERLASPSREGV
ncbi:MAG: hypothetical protein J0I42_19190 [Bosea sp.]|uniref:hypothetical protein n=1 Tax=Bosea sp. (in: a-proteobacteria) TaxID=1871050 RepID=UPI001AD2B4FB|nr:hypothetical protein [Bosea sp. (in: a-proteobacteria)]MBN9454068.1 hypothetical protein [Bosea sp. (in: a-proteobacteria)]